jgi:CBS domain-containing protein
MTRTGMHTEAMLRHLGAAYYESLHGRATAADVARARAAVEEALQERPPGTGQPEAAGQPVGRAPGTAHHHGRFHSRVRDVMRADVVTVDRITPYKEIARLLAEHRISAVPVLMMGRHVAGIVSEDDLLAARDQAAGRARSRGSSRLPWVRRQGDGHVRLTAGALMTSPAITVNPDAPIPRAYRLMHTHHIKRLPVVDAGGKLIGIVSRSDLLRVFLRPDAQIAQQARELLAEILLTGPASVTVSVQGGVVTLSGGPWPADQHDLIPVAERLIWDIDGVVDVIHKLGARTA